MRKTRVFVFQARQYGFPFHFLDFKNGSGMAVTNEEDFDKTDEDLNKEEQTLESKDILAIKG
jgi:predicted ATPase